MAEHTRDTYIDGHYIKVNKPERAHLGEGAPETVCEMASSLSPDVTKANQVLFAAAPDLLAALEAFVEDVRVAYIGEQEPEMVDHSALMHEWPDLVRSFHIARAAIARAKGGQ